MTDADVWWKSPWGGNFIWSLWTTNTACLVKTTLRVLRNVCYRRFSKKYQKFLSFMHKIRRNMMARKIEKFQHDWLPLWRQCMKNRFDFNLCINFDVISFIISWIGYLTTVLKSIRDRGFVLWPEIVLCSGNEMDKNGENFPTEVKNNRSLFLPPEISVPLSLIYFSTLI